MGRSIYLTNKELDYLWLIFSTTDKFENEEEEGIVNIILDKVERASRNREGGYE